MQSYAIVLDTTGITYARQQPSWVPYSTLKDSNERQKKSKKKENKYPEKIRIARHDHRGCRSQGGWMPRVGGRRARDLGLWAMTV